VNKYSTNAIIIATEAKKERPVLLAKGRRSQCTRKKEKKRN